MSTAEVGGGVGRGGWVLGVQRGLFGAFFGGELEIFPRLVGTWRGYVYFFWVGDNYVLFLV